MRLRYFSLVIRVYSNNAAAWESLIAARSKKVPCSLQSLKSKIGVVYADACNDRSSSSGISCTTSFGATWQQPISVTYQSWSSQPYSTSSQSPPPQEEYVGVKLPTRQPSSTLGSRTQLVSPEPSVGKLFEVDWSILSPRGLGYIFRELLADLIGAPPPELRAELAHWRGSRSNRAVAIANVEEIYAAQLRSKSSAESGSLVRGIVYDLHALLRGSLYGSTPAQVVDDQGAKARQDVEEMVKQHWEGMGGSETEADNSISKGGKEVVQGISIDEMAQQMGLGELAQQIGQRIDRNKLGMSSPGVSEGTLPRAPEANKPPPPKSKEKQLEEILGKGDSVRTKYVARLREKQVMAETRREQGKFDLPNSMTRGRPAVKLPIGASSLAVLPGAAQLLIHFRERGLTQALISERPEDELTYLQDSLGNFHFQPSIKLSDLPPQRLSMELLEKICHSWKLLPKQVMLVIGPGRSGRDILKAADDKGFFICKVATSYENIPPPSSLDEPNSNHESKPPGIAGAPSPDASLAAASGGTKPSSKPRAGVMDWYSKLAEGTLHVSESGPASSAGWAHVHFTVNDMTELKWVVEDLNGVSYRRRTFMRTQK